MEETNHHHREGSPCQILLGVLGGRVGQEGQVQGDPILLVVVGKVETC